MKLLTVSALALVLISIVHAQSVAESHIGITANVPDPSEFAPLLNRDLSSYFTKTHGQETTVDIVFLREGPTLMGIKDPYFYVWVRAFTKEKRLLSEGAIRLAAIEKKRFEVRGFISKGDITDDPNRIEAVFPRPLVTKIREMAGVK